MASQRLASLSLAQASRWLQQGRCSSAELVDACASQIAATMDRGLNAWVDVSPPAAVQSLAKAADERRAAGTSLGPLDGIPVSIKANFCEEGRRTTAASKMLEDFVPPYTATAVERLKEAGAIVVGSTNMDEFAMGSASVYAAGGPVVNPWSRREGPALAAGGSSGGSAVAVATGCSFAALGSDTGGSVRLPASYCGIVGLKPTYGRVSRWGLIALASSLDVPGIFARTVEDAAMILDAISGPDNHDSTALPNDYQVAPTLQQSSSPPTGGLLAGLRIGVPAEFAIAELSDEAVAMWDDGVRWLRSEGAEVVPVSIPSIPLSVPAYYVICPAEAASNLACYDGVRYGFRADSTVDADLEANSADALHKQYTASRTQGFGPEVVRRIMVGNYVLSESAREAYLGSAVAVRAALVDEVQQVWTSGVDAVIGPTCPSGPWALDSEAASDVVGMYANDVMTIAANLTGAPAVSVPVALVHAEDDPSTAVPASLQVLGPHGDEATIMRVAQALEKHADFSSKHVPQRVLERQE